MGDILTFSLTVFTSFFAIMNPLANVPIFLSLVEGIDKKTKQEINKKAVFTAFLIVSIFILLGKFIFELFGLTIPAFKITGGILIFFVGFEMLQSKKSSVRSVKESNDGNSIAISPLAIPILAGPGTIVTAMNFTTNADYLKIGLVIFIFALLCVLTYFAFSLSEKIQEKIGGNLISVIGKIMGLIIAIIGVNMIIEGVKLAFDLGV